RWTWSSSVSGWWRWWRRRCSPPTPPSGCACPSRSRSAEPTHLTPSTPATPVALSSHLGRRDLDVSGAQDAETVSASSAPLLLRRADRSGSTWLQEGPHDYKGEATRVYTALRAQGHSAMYYCVDLAPLEQDEPMSLKSLEFAQAAAADLVIE